MKRNTVLSRFMAAVLSIAISVVFMPVLGFVDNAFAEDSAIDKIEITSTEGFYISVEDAENVGYLESTEYKDGKGDQLCITYKNGDTVKYPCVNESWTFAYSDDENIELMVDDWDQNQELPDEFKEGDSYFVDVFVYSAPAATGLTRGQYLEDISVTVGKKAKSVSNFCLDLSKALEIPEKESGSYEVTEINANAGDVLNVEYSDGSTEDFIADSYGSFDSDSTDAWTALHFAWSDAEDPDKSDAIQKEAGDTIEVKLFLKSSLNSGSWVYAKDENGDPVIIPIKIADHTPDKPVRENEKAATEQAKGSYDEVVYCTVCHKEISRETKEIPQLEPSTNPDGGSSSNPGDKGGTAKVTKATVNVSTVNAAAVKKALKASGGKATTLVIGKKVKKISKKAFKGTKIKTLVVKSKKLTKKSVKGSLKGSKVKKIRVKVGKAKENKKYAKKYKKIFTKKNAGKKVSVTKY